MGTKIKEKIFSMFLIILGSLTWSLTMFRSGLKYSFGYGYWGPNGHDGIWHIALSESLSRGFLDNPVFASAINYHLLSYTYLFKKESFGQQQKFLCFFPARFLLFQITHHTRAQYGCLPFSLS